MQLLSSLSQSSNCVVRLGTLATAAVSLLLASCGGGGGGSAHTPPPLSTTYTLSGRIQKGPFAIGSEITVNALDTSLNPTGTVYSTQTPDALGNFALSSKIATPQVEIVAQGFYIDELTGKLSASQIQLRSVSDLSVNDTPTVNVLTTLQEQRLKELVSKGSTFSTADAQSESEVLALFGINVSLVNSLSTTDSMRIDGVTDEDAVLLAVSTILSQMATDTAKTNGTTEAAELSNLVNTIAVGIVSTGTLTSATFAPAKNIANTEIDAATVAGNLQTYYANNGETVTAPPFIGWVDQSNSGVLPQQLVPVSGLVFTSVTAAAPGQPATTNIVTVTGAGAGVVLPVVASKGATIIKNGVAVVGQYAVVKDGDTVGLQVNALGYNQVVTVTLSVGSSSAQRTVTGSQLGGSLSGFTGTGLVLQDGLGDSVSVPAGSTTFSFGAQIALGKSFSVTVLTQPGSPPQICDVNNGTGVAGAAVIGITVVCAAPVAVLYATNQAANDITEYLIHATTGALVSIGAISTSVSPYSMAASPSGQFVYVANGTSTSVSAYAVTGSGSLSSKGTFTSGTDPFSIAVNPSGTFLYVANGEQNGPSQNVAAFSIDTTTGSLTSIGTFAASGIPNSITVDPTGRFVYTTNNNTNNIAMFTADSATGTLTSQGTVTCALPQSIAIEPTGRFAYVPCGNGVGVTAFTIDQTNGALANIGNYALGTGIVSISIDPAGKFVYLSDWGPAAGLPNYTIDTYSIDPTSGALTSVGSIPAGDNAFFTLGPSGNWGLTRHNSNIGVYSVDATTGVLTNVGDFSNGAAPYSLTVIDVH
jgi:6-phosphogluconolactonase (cycloisomerase 2 family)